MKKTLFFAWLVLLAMLVPTMLHAEDANVAEEPQLSLEASLSGDDANPVLTVRLTNIGEVPVIVDKELMFMLRIFPWLVENEKRSTFLKRLEFIKFPENSEVESRLILLKPGEKIERQMPLREEYKEFIVESGFHDEFPTKEPESLLWVFGLLQQINLDFPPTEFEITYDTSNLFVDYVAANMKNIDVAQLYRDKISLSVTVPYEFNGETYSDPKTE